MRYRTKKRKNNKQSSFKFFGWLKRVFFSCLPYLASFTAVAALFGGVFAYAVNSSTFELKSVRILNAGLLTPAQSFKFCELHPGENLVTLDLVNIQQVIKRKNPEYKEVIVKRVLPNRVEVFLKRRTPIAQLGFHRKFVQIDKDLVLLTSAPRRPFKNLTLIEGAKVPRGGTSLGARATDPATSKAVKLVDVIAKSKILRGHALTKVDIADPRNFSLYVDDSIEIKIGDSHFIERLKILDQTLKRVELDKKKIKYVDLRFDDVVIGPR